MTNIQIVWGLVFLIGMFATHYMGVDSWTAWVVWLAVFFFGNIAVDKLMKGKKVMEIKHMWHVVNILGVLITIAFLTNTLVFDSAKVMSVWLILMGGAVFAGAHQSKNVEQIFMGLLWVATGLVLPSWFADVPFLIGGLVFGLPPVISGLLKK
jgi:hypothetical protein